MAQVGYADIGGVKYKLIDNGDGTVALAVSDVSGGGSSDYALVRKSITLTGNASAGAVGTVPLFTVSGSVVVDWCVGVCTVDLVSAGGGTIEVGIATDTDCLALQMNATNLDANEFHEGYTSNPSTRVGAAVNTLAASAFMPFPLVLNQSISLTIGTADVTAGAITYVCSWRALTSGATVTAA